MLWSATRTKTNRFVAGLAGAFVVAFGLAAVVDNFGRASLVPQSTVADEDARQLFLALHKNVYAAFTAPTENDLYDRLAVSMDGELLAQTYLKIRALTARDESATGFQIRRVKPLQSVVDFDHASRRDQFHVKHRWRVYAVVSHFGHRHARINEYQATFAVRAVDGQWRIVAADVHDSQRTDPGLFFASTLP
jgi:hypothetical protein